jgi:Bacterial signalling protein N terminal repeat
VSCNYTGMLALRLPGTMHHSPAMVALSVVIAVVVALVALRLTFQFRDGATGGSRWKKLASALVMGLAIPALHYAAMAGASFTSSDTLSGDMSYAVGSAQRWHGPHRRGCRGLRAGPSWPPTRTAASRPHAKRRPGLAPQRGAVAGHPGSRAGLHHHDRS